MSVTLGEGNTPLLPAPRLSEQLGCELWLKCEGTNPTGSFKDRGMTVAVSRALERGAPGVVCASTGNTAASAAAYAARAGLPAVIVIPKGAVARGKLAQVLAAGADLREVEGTFEEAHALARRLADEEGWVNVNSINPDRIEGQASAAREIVEQLGGPPDVLALPYGGGGNTLAYARGFDEAGARQAASALGAVGQAPRDGRDRDPHLAARPPRAGGGGHRGRDRGRRSAARVVARDRPPRRDLLRARLGGRSRGRRAASPRGARRLRADRPRSEGSRCGGTSLKVRAPGDDGEPRAGLRLRGGGPRSLERGRGQ